MLEWVSTHRAGCGLMGEQGAESIHVKFNSLTFSRAIEQYYAAGAVLKPLCLSKQLTLCCQQHIDQLFPGHIV